ncbi:MAG TPA: DUF2339 domain-containing protein [Gemmatimonadales bacterium]|nr:DUF2339 domain-containing protein [Gemmatimonadales bacterium]
MSDKEKEAIEQLERRVATLENIVRRLTVVAGSTEPRARPLPSPPPSAPPSRPAAPGVTVTAKTDLEQWFGQRGLLAVGVAALLLAAAFFLKYAFDQGWVPPLVRTIGSVIGGIGVAAWGHERIARGMRRYGAAMIGAGGGLVYLGLWAAAGPYALIERRIGILLLAATTVAVTMLALHHELEPLAIWALGGAYLAPLILQTAPNPQGFLGYLEIIGLGTAITAHAMGWRATFNLALFGYLFLAAAGAQPAIAAPLGCWLIAGAALLALHVTGLHPWPETRVGILLGAWILLGNGLANIGAAAQARWFGLAAVVAVWGMLGWQHVRRDPFDGQALEERFLFIASPLALLVLASLARLRLLDMHFEVAPLALAVVYLPIGWLRRSAAHLVTGFVLVGLAMAFPWRASAIVLGWISLALLAFLVERQAARPGGRIASITLAVAAFVCLFSAGLIDRDIPGSRAVFTDRWALSLYLLAASNAALARSWGREDRAAALLWTLCGSTIFLGGSILLEDYFSRVTRLAGDLALSLWWLLFAGALVSIGFRLNRGLVRSTGLAVAAFAGLKIVLYDLSNLEALYRVASFFALAIIALTVAYAYNRRARQPA